MNRIYKVIWNKTRGMYMVVSELAKGQSKDGRRAVGRKKVAQTAAALAVFFSIVSMRGTSYAAGITIGSATVTDSSGNTVTVFTGNSSAASAVEAAVELTVPYNSKQIGILQDAVQSVEDELAQHQNIIDNLGTDKLTLSANNTLQKESYDSATKTTTKTDVTGLNVGGPISAESGKITNSLEVGHNVNVGGAVNAGSLNSRGNLNVDGNALVKGTLTSQSTINGNEIVSQTHITANKKVVGMQGVVDNTLTSGNYVTAGNTVGENIVALDTQVKANADAITAEATAREAADTALTKRIAAEETDRAETDTALQNAIDKEAAERKAADTTLQTNIDHEAAARAAADAALDSRTTALEDKTEAITYDKDSKTVMVDGKLTATEGITDGTTQDGQYVKADHYVGQNLNALDQGLQAETSARVAADTKLVEAVNSGLSLSNDNVLQKNTTTIDAQGNVTTSKTDANEMILNKGNDNQITLNEKGIKVGTNSSVMDANGVYTGGDDYDKAQAAMSADGSIKGAGGKFTVDKDGNVTSKATITGETVTDGKGASMSNGTVTGKTLTDGIATITNGNINTSGSITGGTVTSTGNISAVGDIHAGGAITGASASIQGALTAGSATITGDLTAGGAIQGKSISDGTATMQNGNLTGVKNLSAETITTSGDATIGGDLTVNGKLNVDEIDLTKNGIVEDNNVTASTKVAAGEITSYKKATSTKDGSEKESAIDYDENGTSTWAKSTDADGNWKKSTLTVEGSDVTSKVVDSDKNSNESKQTSTESSDVVKDADGNTSTFSQRVKEILQEIKNASGDTLTKVEQTDTAITSQIGDGSAVKSEMTADGITNTAVGGTITNSAKDLVNTATGDMTNTVGGKMMNDVTGDMENKVGGNLTTTVGGNETHTVGGTVTETVTGDSSLSAQNITNTVSETLSNSAKNITNTAAEKLSNSAAEIENTASKSITDKVGDNVSLTMTTSQIKESVVDGANSNTSTKTASKDMNIVTDGTSTSTLSQLTGSVNTSLKEVDSSGNSVKSLNNVQTVSEDTTKITDTASGDFSSRSQKANGFTSQVKNNSGGSNTVTDTATTSEQKLVSGNIIDILKDAETGYVNTTVSSGTGDDATSTSVKQGTADITNTAKQGTITNEAKNLVNKAEEKLSNSAAEIENIATTSIKDVVGKSTVTTTDTGTTFENTDHTAAIGEGSITQTTISGNTLETGKATADYVDVNKDLTVKGDSDLQGNATVGKDLNVKGNTQLDGNLDVKGSTKLDGTLEVAGKSTFKDDVTMEKNLDVKGTTTTEKLVVKSGATITGGTTTDTLHVTSTATFDGMVTFKDAVSMEKDLTVDGSATVAGDVTAKSYKVGDKTYIDENGINANGQKITNVADGTVAEGSTDAVNGGQLNATNQRVTTVENRMDGVENRMDRVENRVDNLDNRIDKVGANAAAMANLHPMDFDEDSKVSVAAAVGNYRSETAGALGVFYRPTDRVMMNVSTSFGNGENMIGGGVSFKLGKSSKRLEKAEATNAALAKQVTNLQNRLDALLGVLNPSLSKDFPDVPANHWAYEAVSRLAGNDIVQGYEDGKYHGERTMTRYEMAEIIYNALSKGAKAEAKLVEEFRPELQAMAAQRKA
ncbi:ESPR-type extended signal peptide-containing protein [Acidaminococcus sp. LBK-2]|uniref:ESPR-type extended signal peptide-containing protein n=1 Tax=Acidaminococcus sp. LBK-2 TaxID=3456956 RepID=UPI003FA43CEC